MTGFPFTYNIAHTSFRDLVNKFWINMARFRLLYRKFDLFNFKFNIPCSRCMSTREDIEFTLKSTKAQRYLKSLIESVDKNPHDNLKFAQDRTLIDSIKCFVSKDSEIAELEQFLKGLVSFLLTSC